MPKRSIPPTAQQNLSKVQKVLKPKELLDSISSAIEGTRATATFACGGSVSSSALFIFYEDKNGANQKLEFPASADNVKKLAVSCNAASFGRKGKDVLDPE